MAKVKGQKLEQQKQNLVFFVLSLLTHLDSSRLLECSYHMLHLYVQYVAQEKRNIYCQMLLYKNFHNFFILLFD